MGRNSLILKSISYILIGIMVYMHVCSAWCFVAAGEGCCSKSGKESKEKSCCSKQKDSDHRENGCQDFHLAFFKATGQFSSEKNVEVVKVFPFILTEYPNLTIQKSIEKDENLIAFNNYHPPPPIGDIRMFIQSFQI
jgi:hypothetical protein